MNNPARALTGVATLREALVWEDAAKRLDQALDRAHRH